MTTRHSPSLSAVILAGGHSSRMGRDKALLTLPDGLSLLAKTVQSAQTITTDIWIVTPWPQRYQSLMPTSVQFVVEPPFTPELNPPELNPKEETDRQEINPHKSRKPKPSAGPLSGFACGWQQVKSDWCLLLPCDMPHLQPAVLQAWWDWIAAQQAQGWPGYQPLPMASLARGDQGWEPLCGFYHRRGIASLHRQIEQGKRSLRRWLKQGAIAHYSAAPQHMFFNCNLPRDWATVKLSD